MRVAQSLEVRVLAMSILHSFAILPGAVLFNQRFVEKVACSQTSRLVNRLNGGPGHQHIADLRFFPILPRSTTLWMTAGANGTLQSVLPVSTFNRPIRFPASTALSVKEQM